MDYTTCIVAHVLQTIAWTEWVVGSPRFSGAGERAVAVQTAMRSPWKTSQKGPHCTYRSM